MKEDNQLINFVKDHNYFGRLSPQQAEQIKQLVEKYRLPRLVKDTAVITAEIAGIVGHLEIREILSCEEKDLSYSPGNYEYVDTTTQSTQVILWTDYVNEQPYNRQGCVYVGHSFESLGDAVVSKKHYREFNKKSDYQSNICFAIWGFKYNNFYGQVTFGICLEKENVDVFVDELRKIIDKSPEEVDSLQEIEKIATDYVNDNYPDYLNPKERAAAIEDVKWGLNKGKEFEKDKIVSRLKVLFESYGPNLPAKIIWDDIKEVIEI